MYLISVDDVFVCYHYSNILLHLLYRILAVSQSTIKETVWPTFFSERAISVWNYLPYDVVCFNSFNAFKRSIERV